MIEMRIAIWFFNEGSVIVARYSSWTAFICIRELIATVEARDSGRERPLWIGYALAVLLFIFGLLKTVFYHCSFNHMILIGLSVKCSLIGAIYRKVNATDYFFI